jgi:hypothetical protein
MPSRSWYTSTWPLQEGPAPAQEGRGGGGSWGGCLGAALPARQSSGPAWAQRTGGECSRSHLRAGRCCLVPWRTGGATAEEAQRRPAPMPMVGMLSAAVTAAAIGPGMHSSTMEKQPASCSACACCSTRSASPAACAWGLKPPARAAGGAQGQGQGQGRGQGQGQGQGQGAAWGAAQQGAPAAAAAAAPAAHRATRAAAAARGGAASSQGAGRRRQPYPTHLWR